MIENEDIYQKLRDGQKISSKISYSHKTKTNNKSKRLSLGRIWLNTLLPEDFKLIDEAIDNQKLEVLIKQIFDKYGPEKTSKIISKLQQEAFKLATIVPNSFNINGLIIPKELEEKKEKLKQNKDKLTFKEFTKAADEIADEFVKYIKDQGYTLDNILNGKLKSSTLNDWKTVMIAKGYTVDMEGEIYGPIPHGSSDGYTGEEYYKAAAEGRRGFYFKTESVRTPGYLARKVITASANIKLDKKDCNSKKYLELKINKINCKLISGRFYIEKGELVEVKDGTSLIGKTIKLRSPLYCKSKVGICEICYGQLAKKLNSKNIGILAGGAINFIVVNNMMKFRHQTSQVEMVQIDFIKSFQNSKFNMKDLNLLLDVQKNKIIAKHDCRIVIDKQEYSDTTLMNLNDKFIIPGLFDINFSKGDKQTSLTLPLNFKVDLFKPKNIDIKGKLITLNYEEGETIIKKDFYIKDEDPAIVNRLFEGQLKFIKDPQILLNLIIDELPTADIIHLELVVSNMFRNEDDPTVPCRLTNYKNPVIIGQKKLPFVGSWLNALAFENINKAVEVGLVNNKDAELNPLEKIMLEESQTGRM